MKDHPAIQRACAFLLFSLFAHLAIAGGIEVRTLAGQTSSLAEQISANHFTVVMMWTTYCPVCKKEYPEVSAFHEAHVGKDAEVLGISLDGYGELNKVKEFISKKPFTFPSVIAEPARMAKSFEAATGDKFTGTPTYLVFDPKRQLVAARSGDLTRDVLENFIRKHAAVR